MIKDKDQQYGKKKETTHWQTAKQTTITLACTEGYSRLTRLIGRLVMHQPFRNYNT